MFIVCSFLICIPLAFYYQLAERVVAQSELALAPLKMTYGQISEILFMLLMPLFFLRLGVKWMLTIGMLAWVVRYGLFAYGAPDGIWWMVMIGVSLHGICYDFFFVTGQIYTDKAANPQIRGQAQGLLVLFTLGFGMLIGAQVAGVVETRMTPKETGILQAEAGAVGKEIARLQTDYDKRWNSSRPKSAVAWTSCGRRTPRRAVQLLRSPAAREKRGRAGAGKVQ